MPRRLLPFYCLLPEGNLFTQPRTTMDLPPSTSLGNVATEVLEPMRAWEVAVNWEPESPFLAVSVTQALSSAHLPPQPLSGVAHLQNGQQLPNFLREDAQVGMLTQRVACRQGAGLAVRRWLTPWGAISGQRCGDGGSWLASLLGRGNR